MKRAFVSIFCIVVSAFLNAQELPYRVIASSPYYSNKNGQHYIGDLQIGEIIQAGNHIDYNRIIEGEPYAINIWFTKDGSRYITYAKNVIPVETEDLFLSDIQIDHEVIADLPKEIWLPEYYQGVLKSKNRETLTTFEPRLLTLNEGYEPRLERDIYWFDYAGTDFESGIYLFCNAAIRAGLGNAFAIQNISKTDYGYSVQCIGPNDVYNAGPAFDWSVYRGGDGSIVTLLLYIDGDYLDMYMNDTAHKFGTLVRVKEEFIRQYQSLIHDNTCDLANVQWPRWSRIEVDIVELPVAAQETAVIEEAAKPEESAEPETEREISAPAAPQKEPLPWFVIGGGVFVLAGGMVLFMTRKRKRRG